MLLTVAGISSYAQSVTTADTLGVITGRVVDGDGDALPGISMRVLKASDSTNVAIAITDTLGQYRIAHLPMGSYVMQYSLIGYTPGLVKFNILPTRKAITIPELTMQSNDRRIGEAVIVGHVPPVTVIDDTVAYNADAIDVPEGSMVETLIENLPGAQITDDGKIKINGKEYTEILVDGKEFFGGNTQMALKNLPANIVKRIKTYDRRSRQARLTGIDDGEEVNVLDIQIKPNMFKGLVGSASAALGSHERYSSNLNVHRFRTDKHFSILGGMNNINNPGFSERGSNAMNFSNASRPGLTAAKSLGTNFFIEKRKHYKLHGNATYSYSNASQASDRRSETIYNDTNRTFNQNENRSTRRRREFHASLEWEWRPDTLTTLNLRPNFSYNTTNNLSGSESFQRRWNTAQSLDTLAINHQLSSNENDGKDISSGASLNIHRRLNARGRNLSIDGSYNYSSGSSEGYSRNQVTYFRQPSRNRNYRRFNDNHNYRFNYSTGFSYNEPIVEHLYLQLRYSYNYSRARNSRYGHEVDYAGRDSVRNPADYIFWSEVPIDTALSNVTMNAHQSHNINISTRYTASKFNVNIGARLNPRHNEVNYIFGPKMDKGLITQELFNWSPTFNMRYRFTKHTGFNLSYNGNSDDPNIDDLQEIIDKTNPQNVRYGNPNLRPSYTNRLNGRFNHYSEKTRRSIVANWNYSTQNHSTSNMTLYESSTGVRVSKLMNVDGRWNVGGDINFNTPLDSLQRFNLSTESSASYNESTNYNSTPLEANDLADAGITCDFQDILPDDMNKLLPLALKNRTSQTRISQSLSLRYHIKVFSFRLNAGVNYFRVSNSVQKSNERETFDYNTRLNIQAELPLNIQINTGIDYQSRHGYAANIQKNVAIWNASVTYRFLKHNAGLLTFQVFDILKQRNNITRSINNLTISDTRSDALRNYCMLGFMYRINTMGNRKQRGGEATNNRYRSDAATRKGSSPNRQSARSGNSRR